MACLGACGTCSILPYPSASLRAALQVRTYVNGTLYSILTRPSLRDQAQEVTLVCAPAPLCRWTLRISTMPCCSYQSMLLQSCTCAPLPCPMQVGLEDILKELEPRCEEQFARQIRLGHAMPIITPVITLLIWSGPSSPHPYCPPCTGCSLHLPWFSFQPCAPMLGRYIIQQLSSDAMDGTASDEVCACKEAWQ